MFPDLAKFQPDDSSLIALGQALNDPFVAGAGDSDLPAGFTYLGQFVDHDITFDRTDGIPDGSLEPKDIEQGRSPALELDSVYGRGPKHSPELYEADGVRLRIGTTTGRALFGVTKSFPNDLPRHPESDPAHPKQAIIGDPRNDENLIVAQTHLAFLKFHNAVVARLTASAAKPDNLFAEARKTVVQHYQSIVLHDFVPRLVDLEVWRDVLTNGRKFFFPKGAPSGSRLGMPVEFSVAAYRMGHSLVRNAYQWNSVFSSDGRAGFVPRLNLFFEFSQVSGDLGGFPTLPSDWIVDWRRMFDFSEQPGGGRHPQLNFARQIDTKLANDLQLLPEFATAEQEHLKSLAVRNLLRGRLIGLPTGQDVAARLGVPSLTPAEVASGPHAAVILASGFDTQTPLWFYILKEAELRQGGMRLGTVGSRLLCETFHGLIEGSDYSI
ncbi:MAG TPA: heme peroxidase family protein, partial [Gemmatales bacterium]|nr:heme peroxidase family protein [Gemmatales bacterium]